MKKIIVLLFIGTPILFLQLAAGFLMWILGARKQVIVNPDDNDISMHVRICAAACGCRHVEIGGAFFDREQGRLRPVVLRYHYGKCRTPKFNFDPSQN